MSAPRPQTVASKVLEELKAFVRVVPRYLDETDPRLVAWNDELDKGFSVARRETFKARAIIAHLSGDVDFAERQIERAETMGEPYHEARGARMSIYGNLGYFSRTADLGAELCREEPMVSVPNNPATLAASGAFAALRKVLEISEQRGNFLMNHPQFEQLRQIAAGTRDLGHPDAAYSAVMDLAGTVLRDRRLFWLGTSPTVFFDDEFKSVGVRFKVLCSPLEASAMESDFLDRVLSAELDAVPLSVGFVGTDV